MKTTIEIADDLAESARAYAARERITFRSLIERALREVLRAESRRNARDFLRQRPQEARLAGAVALEAAAAQCEAHGDDASIPAPERLEPFIVRRPKGQELIGVSQAAVRLEVSRTTVYDWAAKGTLLAWKSTKRGLTIPAAQILGPGKVVPDLARVLGLIGDPELAWMFLTQEWPFADEAARPLDRLMAGRTEEVLDAAPGFGTTFT